MKNVSRIIGIIAIIVAVFLGVFLKVDNANIISIAVGSFGVALTVISMVSDASSEETKTKITTHICIACACIGGIFMAVGGMEKDALTTIIAAAFTFASIIISYLVVKKEAK